MMMGYLSLSKGYVMKWYTYILLCSNDSYYVGHTNNVENRFQRHVSNNGAQHTAVFAPEKVLYKEEFLSQKEAMRREKQIKKWSRAKKQALIDGNFERLKVLKLTDFRPRGVFPSGE